VVTGALSVQHPRPVLGPDQWQEPGDLVAEFGFGAAHWEWVSGYGLAVHTDLGAGLVRARGVVPVAVDERLAAGG
jgi:hypothetical protein